MSKIYDNIYDIEETRGVKYVNLLLKLKWIILQPLYIPYFVKLNQIFTF